MEQRLAWRTDSCAECKGPGGEDLSGGYYEAGGSYLKFSFPTAFTITQLAWGVVEHRSGYEKARCTHLSPCGSCCRMQIPKCNLLVLSWSLIK